MQQLSIGQTKWAEHLRGCADLAKEIANRMDIREDPARQAMLATIIISADRHNLFLEPFAQEKEEAENGNKTPVIQPEAVAASNATKEGGTSKERDEAAAAKADAQIAEIDPNPTPEKAESVERATLLEAIDKGRNALNKAGYTPIMTPKVLNEAIKSELGIEGNLGTLDRDQLDRVAKMLVARLDTFKSNLKALEAEAPF